MRKPDAPPITRGVVLRIFVLVFAVALAGIAAWLIVTGKTTKRVEVGVIVGLWSALLGGFALYDARRSAHVGTEAAAPSAAELELRTARTELARAEEAAARRAHEARLEQLLRAEVQAAISREVNSLRSEIADLRGELLEKVGNQVRLERIETTRVIGSDLEALQHEVRKQLEAVAREVGDISTSRAHPAEPPTLRPIVEPARIRPVSREAAEVQAEVQPATSDQPTERVVEPEPPRPTPTVDWNAGTPEPPRPSPTPPPAPAPEREAIVLPLDSRVDTLSGLPRIEPFTEFELDPIEDEESASYTGRRRRGEEDEEAGRHSRSDGPGRRRRNEDDENDLLAKLLARETH